MSVGFMVKVMSGETGNSNIFFLARIKSILVDKINEKAKKFTISEFMKTCTLLFFV